MYFKKMSTIIPVLHLNSILVKELQKVLPSLQFHEVKRSDNDEILKNSKIIIADADLLGPHLYDLPNAKWVQLTWAGVEKFMKFVEPNKSFPYMVTRFSGYHFGAIMSEYVVAQIVNIERNFHQINRNQIKSEWNRDGTIKDYRTIYDLTIGILGLGHIGRQVAKVLNFMGANVLGYSRTIKPAKEISDLSFIKKFYTQETLPDFLSNCDYIVNILPSTNETKNLMGNGILENCKEKGSIFINIGRGSIIEEDDLITALKEKWISGAVLDVFQKEPLSSSSQLWNFPNVIITPHVAGYSREKDIAEQFKINLELYERNIPISTTVDLTRGF